MFLLLAFQDELSDMKSTVDDNLILAVASADRTAFETLYQNTYKSVYGFVLSITKNSHDAEDVLQETYLTIYRKSCEYRANGKPLAWIFTIAKNLSLMKIRERKCESETDENIQDLSSFKKIQQTEDRIILEASFKILSDQERQIVMLHAISGLKNREIAKLMELPLNTVLSKYNRSVRKIRDYINNGGENYEE